VSYKASQALRPFADLLCVPIWTIILLIHPPVLSGCTRTKEVARNVLEFCRRSISFMLSNVLLHAIKTYDMCPPALLPIRRKACCGLFIAIKNPSPWPGLNPRPLGPEASSLTTTPPKRLHNIDTRNWIREQTVIHATRWERFRRKSVRPNPCMLLGVIWLIRWVGNRWNYVFGQKLSYRDYWVRDDSLQPDGAKLTSVAEKVACLCVCFICIYIKSVPEHFYQTLFTAYMLSCNNSELERVWCLWALQFLYRSVLPRPLESISCCENCEVVTP
jgi:hypothetical protein